MRQFRGVSPDIILYEPALKGIFIAKLCVVLNFCILINNKLTPVQEFKTPWFWQKYAFYTALIKFLSAFRSFCVSHQQFRSNIIKIVFTAPFEKNGNTLSPCWAKYYFEGLCVLSVLIYYGNHLCHTRFIEWLKFIVFASLCFAAFARRTSPAPQKNI